MVADRDQLVADVTAERRGRQQRLTQDLAQALDPAHQIDRRADHGEVEPALTADVAVDHAPDVEGDAELERRGAGRGRAAVRHGERVARRERGRQRPLAGRRQRARLTDREHREEAVAHELQDLAAGDRDRVHQRLVVRVERGEQLLDAPARRLGGEVAQIGEQDDRRARAGRRRIPPFSTSRPGPLAEIGVEQRARGAPPLQEIQHQTQGPGEVAQLVALLERSRPARRSPS